jgi:alkylation response protein AidB-like acyl-CoA dehydrogenase/acyl carrier protein
VSCGQPKLEFIIVNPESLYPCQAEEVGEIWVSGSSVARGYWNQPQQTQEAFCAYLATGEGPFLRTGDLGFLQDCELFVTGRIKEIIIIRGHNYYPQDIEQTAEQSHPALRQGSCTAFSIDGEEEQLAVAVEIKREYLRNLDSEAIIEAIRSAISKEYGLQTYAILLLKQGGLPKTSSGKIQRHACKRGYLDNRLEAICCWQIDPRNRQPAISKEKTARSFSSSHALSDSLIQWLRSYANEQINSRLIDERRCIPPYVVLDFGNQGLLGMQVPPEYGGLGLNHVDTMRVLEQLGAIDPTLSLFVGLNNILGIRPILNYGTQTAKEELLPPLATGRELAAFALTEPGAGSNPQAIASRAISHPHGGWLLRGTKIWSGSAAWAGVINVFVQHQNGEGKFRGISGFAVRKGSKGLRQGPEALTMGMRGMVQNTVYLNDVPVSAAQLLGEPGAGMKVAQDAMMYGRLAIAAASVGGMKRCAQLMLRYSSRRSVSTGRLLDNPVVLTRLNGLTAAITAVEVLVTSLAQLLDRGYVIPVEAYTVCKTAAPEFYWQAADNLVQFLGGRGYIETNMAPQILRDARVLRIFEGPTETLNMFLGSRVINQSEDLQQFLCQTLGTPEVYQHLMAAAQQICDRCTHSQSPFSDLVTAKRWASILTGEIATFAILLGVLQARAARSNSESLCRAIAWTQKNFDQKLAQALSKTPDELVISNAEVTAALITDYEATIGDLEQTLAGEDNELDELLKKSLVEDEGDWEDRETGRLGEFIDYPLPTTHLDEIQEWLIDWLAKKLKLPPQSIDPSQSFADYGIDSVIAVELAQDLQDWLAYPQELEATLAWNFPTIESLTQYLTTLLETAQPSPQPDLAPQSNKIEPEIVSEIKAFSEDEIQASIAQEMAELESLLQER